MKVTYPYTEDGRNMYDMMSMLQKSIRRGNYPNAGYAAKQLKGGYRTAMWNRLLVISAEDCFGVITKEIVDLRKKDKEQPDDINIARAVALMCLSKKNRDACYFACNFVLASRKPREINPDESDVRYLVTRIKSRKPSEGGYDAFGFYQTSLFDNVEDSFAEEIHNNAATLQIAIDHNDMDMIGWEMDVLRMVNRELLWDTLEDYAIHSDFCPSEIRALREADEFVNARKKTGEKDEIFISKATMILCHAKSIGTPFLKSSRRVDLDVLIDWRGQDVMPLAYCTYEDPDLPDWVYDCHTLKGKKMGKTDWDMTLTEQNALYPLQKMFFDDASWIYTYEDDYKNGRIDDEGMYPIRMYARTHEANPVQWLPYTETPTEDSSTM